jgi:hypothetical protein
MEPGAGASDIKHEARKTPSILGVSHRDFY